ncbi:aspartate kinase [Vulgatibacter incomptus]|uniref:Aspartokinase n=1 Tax=Vulgatibacter incomptus TaxID=1391653 RepID=A0A0K1PE17_9BACT|nr:aspartate kinase [Vulgatibacter incomptus]AKU91369.1 Aspartokinase [Vulgatibacter incomptus]
MNIVVQKYGGSSVADVEKIGRVADRVARTREAGKRVVVVVSAMGDTTDELLSLAKQVCENPARRELDMLLTAGERISMALLSMALNARGVPAVSFTGSQSGIITTDTHSNARIVEVRPFRVQEELDRGKVVIVAGYQGVSLSKEVTTLGRGGSDTTAVALAAALGAEACEIYSDVEGVYTADPRLVRDARRLAELSYEEMQELAEAGAKVLHAQAVEFAKEKGIAIHARSTFGGSGETKVQPLKGNEGLRIAGVTSEKGLALLCASPGSGAALAELLEHLDGRSSFGKQLLFDREPAGSASLVLSRENLHDFDAVVAELSARFGGGVRIRPGLGAVSAIGAGINASFANVRKVQAVLASMEAEPLQLSTSSFRISVLLEEHHVDEAVRRLHAELVP